MLPFQSLTTSACSGGEIVPVGCLYTFNEPEAAVIEATYDLATISPDGTEISTTVSDQVSDKWEAAFPLGTSAGVVSSSPFYFDTTSGLVAFEADLTIPTLDGPTSPEQLINVNIELVEATYYQLAMISAIVKSDGTRTLEFNMTPETGHDLESDIVRIGFLVDCDNQTYSYTLDGIPIASNVPILTPDGFSTKTFMYIDFFQSGGSGGLNDGKVYKVKVFNNSSDFFNGYPPGTRNLCGQVL